MNPMIAMLESAESHYQAAIKDLTETTSPRGLLRRMNVAAIAYATLCDCMAQAEEEGAL